MASRRSISLGHSSWKAGQVPQRGFNGKRRRSWLSRDPAAWTALSTRSGCLRCCGVTAPRNSDAAAKPSSVPRVPAARAAGWVQETRRSASLQARPTCYSRPCPTAADTEIFKCRIVSVARGQSPRARRRYATSSWRGCMFLPTLSIIGLAAERQRWSSLRLACKPRLSLAQAEAGRLEEAPAWRPARNNDRGLRSAR